MSNRLIDMAGRKFGRILVISRTVNTPGGQARWNCQCDCGRFFATSGAWLRNGSSQSCGCARKEKTRARNTTHGHAPMGRATRTYRIWCAIHRRCNNRNTRDFQYYGGRGISVCDRWQKFENFLADMGEAPANLSIDRIDNNGNYEPGNCQWATQSQQVKNRRRLPKVTMEAQS